MAQDIATVADATSQFRDDASEWMKQAAEMTLHDLVDEYVRLGRIVASNTTKPADEDDWAGPQLNETGKYASAARAVINGAARARFGLSLNDALLPTA